jgi:hypothetical protein
MSRTKGAKNLEPTLDASIYVRCRPGLKSALRKVKGKSESAKVVEIVLEYLKKKGISVPD